MTELHLNQKVLVVSSNYDGIATVKPAIVKDVLIQGSFTNVVVFIKNECLTMQRKYVIATEKDLQLYLIKVIEKQEGKKNYPFTKFLVSKNEKGIFIFRYSESKISSLIEGDFNEYTLQSCCSSLDAMDYNLYQKLKQYSNNQNPFLNSLQDAISEFKRLANIYLEIDIPTETNEKEPKELSVSEIEKLLGYPIKIVK